MKLIVVVVAGICNHCRRSDQQQQQPPMNVIGLNRRQRAQASKVASMLNWLLADYRKSRLERNYQSYGSSSIGNNGTTAATTATDIGVASAGRRANMLHSKWRSNESRRLADPTTNAASNHPAASSTSTFANQRRAEAAREENFEPEDFERQDSHWLLHKNNQQQQHQKVSIFCKQSAQLRALFIAASRPSPLLVASYV